MATAGVGTGIVVGVDGSPGAEAAVAWAARDAELRGRPLQLVHAVPPIVMPVRPWPELPGAYVDYAQDRARQITEDAVRVAVAATGPDRVSQVSAAVLDGPAVSTLVELSETADMVVTGRVGGDAVSRAAGVRQHRARASGPLPGGGDSR